MNRTIVITFFCGMLIGAGYVVPRADETKAYDDLIVMAALKNNLDPALLKAVIKVESNFNHTGVSHKGARGLMQLMPETARCLGVKQIFSPEENIHAGARYLRYLIVTFNNDLELALAAYNAGPHVVRRYKRIPPYRETRRYVKDVYRYYQYYSGRERIYTCIDEQGCMYMYNIR